MVESLECLWYPQKIKVAKTNAAIIFFILHQPFMTKLGGNIMKNGGTQIIMLFSTTVAIVQWSFRWSFMKTNVRWTTEVFWRYYFCCWIIYTHRGNVQRLGGKMYFLLIFTAIMCLIIWKIIYDFSIIFLGIPLGLIFVFFGFFHYRSNKPFLHFTNLFVIET